MKVRATITDFATCGRMEDGRVLVDLLSGKDHLALRFRESDLREMIEGLLSLLGDEDPRCLRAYCDMIDEQAPTDVPPPSEN